MNASRFCGIVLMIAGVMILVYGGLSWTQETQRLKLGPTESSMNERDKSNIPVWAGFGAFLLGGAFLLAGGRKD
jgi:hypothetical protein